MTAVVDASVFVALLTDSGDEGEWAKSVVDEGPLAGPHFVLVETSNLLRRLELASRISRTDSADALGALLSRAIHLYPFAPFGERVWELRHNLTCYDAWYVAVAEALACPLLTLDRRLARATGPTCPIITPPGRG